MKYMGIDVGTKRIGIAASDETGRVAFPQDVLTVSSTSTDFLCEYIARERIGAVVIGSSLNRMGGKNPVADDAELLARALHDAHPTLPIFFHWEGYSSAHARRVHDFIEGAPRGDVARRTSKKNTKIVDATAAALVLQSYLDSQNA